MDMYKWTKLRTASRNCTFYRTLLFLFTVPVCCAVLVNRTIDNSFGDPVTGFIPIYQPQDLWFNQTCATNCLLQPDKAKAFDGTWNSGFQYDPNVNVNVTLQFTGVAIWVFFILPDFSIYEAYTMANFTLDGKSAGTFSHYPGNTTDMIYNATIFYTSGLANISHELVIEANGYPEFVTLEQGTPVNWLVFDWAIYTVDLEPSTTSPSTTNSSSTVSTTLTSSSKIGVVVGSTLGGLAMITIVLVFLVRLLRRAPPVRNGNAEKILDIDVPPHHQPYYEREIPVQDHGPKQSKAAWLREARQRELDERIQSAQHELDNLRSLRNASSAGDPSAAGPSRPSPEFALLRNEMQELRDRVDYLQVQRESDWAQGLSDEPIPPAYSQLSNTV